LVGGCTAFGLVESGERGGGWEGALAWIRSFVCTGRTEEGRGAAGHCRLPYAPAYASDLSIACIPYLAGKAAGSGEGVGLASRHEGWQVHRAVQGGGRVTETPGGAHVGGSPCTHTHSDTCRANAAASMPCWPPFSDVCARYAHRVADSRNTCTPRAKDKLALHWRPHVNDPSFIVWNTVFFWHPAEPAV
jgi:hypothetical protein